MFTSIANNIDPKTGKPYAFGISGGQWALDGTDRNSGGYGVDQGSGVQDYLHSMHSQLDPAWLANMGYTGPTTVQTGSGESYGTAIAPELEQFFKDKGYTLGNANYEDDPNNFYLNAFDANGNAVNDPLKASNDDKEFGWALAAAAAAATAGAAAYGGAGAGAGAGAAGAGSGAGIGADSLAYGALENGAAYGGGYGSALTASSEAGLGGALGEGAAGAGAGAAGGGSADLAALYGAEGYGAAASPTELALGGGGATAGGAGAAGAAGSSGSWLDAASAFAKANPTLINAGGGLVNGLIGAYTSGKAIDAAKDASAASDARLAPWITAGTNALGQIDTLLKNPSTLSSQPDYQFELSQGLNAAKNGAASRGMAYSGAQDKALTRFGQGLASTKLNDSFDRLARVAGLGAGPAQTSANNGLTLGSTIGAGDLYTGALIQQGINNTLGNWNYSQFKKKTPGP
jgi:hypothetical protein